MRGVSGKKSKSRGKVFCNFKIPSRLGKFYFSLDENEYTFFEAVKKEGWNIIPDYAEFVKEMNKKFGHIEGYIPHEKVWEDLASQGLIDQELLHNINS